MVLSFLAQALLCSCLALPAPAEAPRLRVEPEPVEQGGLLLVELEGGDVSEPAADWLGKSYPLYAAAGGYRVLLPVDRQQTAGPAELVVRARGGAEPLARRAVTIVELDTGPIEIIRLAPDRMALQKDPRLARDSKRIAEVLRTRSPAQLCSGPFQQPLDALGRNYLGRNYGKQRRYEEVRSRRRRKRAPARPAPSFAGYHRGLDFSADPGTPVVAANAGRVLAAERFVLPGNAVFLDHGQGLITSYFHMQEIRVQAGAVVARGEVIGTVGSTGRSTGPHLHWSVYAQGQTVNPATLASLPARLYSLPGSGAR